jgi:uncharacterized membrane protein YebE (DUF533 family)
MKFIAITLSLLTLATTTLPGIAGPKARTPGVKQRQGLQHHRIKQGVKSGQLTPEEAKNLKQEEQAIQTEKKAYKADGVVTRAERKDLHQDLNQASRDIHADKHNAQTVPAPTPASGNP